MALQKSKELASGVSGDYWKQIINKLTGVETSISMFLYKDQASRDAGKQPLMCLEYTWSGDANPCTIAAMNVADTNAIKLCYEKLKADEPDFAGAQDV